jgi:hypothetical protein
MVAASYSSTVKEDGIFFTESNTFFAHGAAIHSIRLSIKKIVEKTLELFLKTFC